MHLTPRSAWLFILIGAALAAGIAILLPGGLELRVDPVRGGDPLAVLFIQPDDRFTISYFHSVEGTPIWETHSVDAQGRIFIEEEKYLKSGAGMGKMPGIGHMEMQGPYEVIKDMHMPTGNFILRIGSPGVAHTLTQGSFSVNLSALAPHTAVKFTARPVSLLRRLYQSMISPKRQPSSKETHD
ncbi:MAG: DUF1850 domain-containing protein [Pseudomonadota bacterium]